MKYVHEKNVGLSNVVGLHGQIALFGWAYFRGSLFLEGLIIGGNFAFQNGLGVTIKNSSKHSSYQP